LYEADWSFESTEEFWKYIRMIDTSLQDNEYYVRLVRLTEQAEKVQIGKIAPDFTMPDSGGAPRILSDAWKASEYLLMDFWVSNCSPCRQLNPCILAAFNEFPLKGFNVFGGSSDTDRKSWLRAMEQDGRVWTNVCSFEKWNDHPVVMAYALSQTSQNFLLDREGRIIARDLWVEDLEETLGRLFN
jgi:peroxiredoxin